MEGESLRDTLFDQESVEDAQAVGMLDVEEGELIEQISKTDVGESCDVGGNQVSQESNKKNSRHKKKKKTKRKRGSKTGPNVTNINRFVLDTSKHLQERKSYLVWTAVGCLGVLALSDLLKMVDAIQACGGQKTADGSRFWTDGGILWSIIKARDPNAYKEIMRKGRELRSNSSSNFTISKNPSNGETLLLKASLLLPIKLEMGQAQSTPVAEDQSSPTTTSTVTSAEIFARSSLDYSIAQAVEYGDEDDNNSLEVKAQKALECPCIDHLRSGPCGAQFSDAFVCFLKSTAEEKGSDCVHPFVALQNCIKANPNAFPNDILEEEDSKKEEKPSPKYKIRPPLWSGESKASNR